MNTYWFDITGKVYANSPEQASELLNRYAQGIYVIQPDIKVTEINIEETIDEL